MTIPATLCFLVENNKVLLLKKSKGLLGQGKWNARRQDNGSEEPKSCAIREVFEETGLIVENVEQVGLLYFYKNRQRETPDWTVHAFLAHHFIGIPIRGREGRLKWFNVDALPFDEMWEDDQYWCRLALEGTRLEGWFYFSRF